MKDSDPSPRGTFSRVHRLLVVPLCLATAALAWLAYRDRAGITTSSFTRWLPLENPVSVALDARGNVYALDGKYYRILKIDPEGRVISRITVHPARPRIHYEFYDDIAVDPGGDLYVARVVYFLDSERIDYEEIVRFDAAGRERAVLFTLDHGEDADTFDARILTLEVQGGAVWFDVRSEQSVAMWSVPATGGIATERFTIPAGAADIYNHAGTTRRDLVIVSYSGDRLMRLDATGALVDLKLVPESARVPGIVLADKVSYDRLDRLLITDLYNQCVYRTDESGRLSLLLSASDLPGQPERALFKDVWASPDGRMAVIDQTSNSIFVFGADGALERRVTGGVPSLELWVTLLVPWGLAAAAALMFAGTLACAYFLTLGRRMALVLKLTLAFVPLVVLLVAFVSTRIFNQVFARYEQEILNRLAATTQVGARLVDGDAVARLRSTSDYLGEDYNRVCSQLAGLINEGKDPWNQRMYASVVKLHAGVFYIMADSTATYGVLYPQALAPADRYLAALETGEVQSFQYTDADGTYLEAAAPVRDGAGRTVGVLYVGSSRDDLAKLQEIFQGDVRASAAAAAAIFLVAIVLTSLFLLLSVNRLRGAVGRMAGGQFDTEVHIRSRDEIGELGQGFNAMSGSIRGYIGEITTMSESYARFVPREFLRLLAKERIGDIGLGNQVELEMAILFADIRSFTALSERMRPQENFIFLNSFLSRIGPVVRKHEGFIDKYIGDGIMALFPRRHADAVEAAIEMQQELDSYNAHRRKSGYAPIQVGIGVHAGKVMLGVIGEAQRLEGTVISDAVNLASRMEGLTKTYGARIIVTEGLTSTGATTDHRFLGRTPVKGRHEPVNVHEVFAGDPPEDVRMKRLTRLHFEHGVELYLAGDVAAAVRYFAAVRKDHPADRAAAWYLAVCRKILAGARPAVRPAPSSGAAGPEPRSLHEPV